jgi:integrase/recombinase XerD
MTLVRKRMLEELQRRNYSGETVREYILAVKQFAQYFGKSPDLLRAEEIRRFQLYLLTEKKLAPATVKLRMAALHSFIGSVLSARLHDSV